MMRSVEPDWEFYWRWVESVRSVLSRTRSVNVNKEITRNDVRELVQEYFRTLRPALVKLGLKDEVLAGLDSPAQELLRLATGRNARSSYVKAFRAFHAARIEVDAECELRMGHSSHPPDAVAPISEVLDHLAPDADVLRSPGFKLEKDATRPTMKQKAQFIPKARGTASGNLSTPKDAIQRVEDASASLARSVYTRGSVSTHGATTREEVPAALDAAIRLLETETDTSRVAVEK